VKRGASDIHMEPYEKEMRVRFRIDGVLQTVMNPPLKLRDAITSRLKIMSKLDIAEKRLPQDGRIMIKYKADGRRRNWTSAFPRCPRCTAKKSFSGCWTRKTCGWT
jgi:type IV pilus assembly protein PilB